MWITTWNGPKITIIMNVVALLKSKDSPRAGGKISPASVTKTAPKFMAILSNFHGPEPHFPIETGIPRVDPILRQINDEIEISPKFPQLLTVAGKWKGLKC